MDVICDQSITNPKFYPDLAVRYPVFWERKEKNLNLYSSVLESVDIIA